MGKVVKNKYDKVVYLPNHSKTKEECYVEQILKDLNVEFLSQFFFDEAGFRRMKYDFAVLGEDARPAFLIEVDGPDHYSEQFYISTGVRPERAKAHVVKRNIGDAEKDRVALEHGLIVLHVNACNKDNMRDLIISYIWKFVDKHIQETVEVSMHKMLSKYGFDFEYIIPSELGKEEEIYLTDIGLVGGDKE